jgi:flagellar biosynthesis anti-sigma factor FlgM
LLQKSVSAVNKPGPSSSKNASPRSKSGVVTAFQAKRRKRAEAAKAEQRNASTARTDIPEQTLKDLRDTIDQLPEINATRVVQLHQRIAAEEYVIDLERLTDKLLALESALNKE